RQNPAEELQGASHPHRDLVQGWTVRRGVACLQPRRWAARRRPSRRRLHHLSLHGWKFHRRTGVGEPGFEEDRVPAFPVNVESGRVLVNGAAPSRRTKARHQPHPLSRKPERAPGPLRLAGISTTVMDMTNPRFSGSDYLLDRALKSGADL